MLSIFTKLYFHNNFSGKEMSLKKKQGLFYIRLLIETYNKICVQFKARIYILVYLSVHIRYRQTAKKRERKIWKDSYKCDNQCLPLGSITQLYYCCRWFQKGHENFLGKKKTCKSKTAQPSRIKPDPAFIPAPFLVSRRLKKSSLASFAIAVATCYSLWKGSGNAGGRGTAESPLCSPADSSRTTSHDGYKAELRASLRCYSSRVIIKPQSEVRRA